MALTGDMKQVFFQVRIREEDRDALRFHWIRDLETQVADKARLAKQGLTIPRLELVSGRMAMNLNVKEASEGFPVGEMVCWLDSSVCCTFICNIYSQQISILNL